jgi:hypothetical protein
MDTETANRMIAHNEARVAGLPATGVDIRPTLAILQHHVGGCREWPVDEMDACGKPAEFVLWGKLIPPEGLGPRCYDCAAKHVGHNALGSHSGFALIRLADLACDIHVPNWQRLSPRTDRDERLDEYRDRLRAMTNRQLIDEAGGAIHAAAIMARMRHNDGWEDDKADACYDEAVSRGNTDLYQRAFNDVARSQGHNSMRVPVSTPIEVGER